MMTRISLLLFVALIGSCTPDPEPSKLYDELVVTTNRDEEADFKTYATYSIPTDTIGLLSNTIEDTVIVSEFSRAVLTQLKFNLNAKGYTQVNRTENPDIGVNVLVIHGFDVIQQVIYPDPFFNQGGFYSGYYGYNSWYYYPYVNTYTYNNGVLVVELVDLKNRSFDNKVKVIWDAYLGDITVNTNIVNQAIKGIDEAFAQSPYITK